MWRRIAAAATSCRFFADPRSKGRRGGEEKGTREKIGMGWVKNRGKVITCDEEQRWHVNLHVLTSDLQWTSENSLAG